MHKRSKLLVSGVVAVAFLFAAVGLYAASDVPDVIKMEDKAYKKHKQPIVEFHHKKHVEDYEKKHPDFYKNGCGECHHDENNKPLSNLKPGDDVQSCIACHKKPGDITGKKAKGLSKKQKLEYQAYAVHENCRGCHKSYNKKNKLKSKSPGYAPTTCKKCHKK